MLGPAKDGNSSLLRSRMLRRRGVAALADTGISWSDDWPVEMDHVTSSPSKVLTFLSFLTWSRHCSLSICVIAGSARRRSLTAFLALLFFIAFNMVIVASLPVLLVVHVCLKGLDSVVVGCSRSPTRIESERAHKTFIRAKILHWPKLTANKSPSTLQKRVSPVFTRALASSHPRPRPIAQCYVLAWRDR